MLQLTSIFRKQYIIFMAFFNCYAAANIVFVHLGSKIPTYLYVALEQARLFNSECDIYAVLNAEAVATSEYNFTTHNFKVVLCEELAMTNEHKLFLEKSSLDASFRDGFWRKATERFFYVHELMVAKKLTAVVHLESDNMLYVDLAEIKGALHSYKGIGAVFDCDNRCIPSFVYIADQQALYGLVNFIAENALRGHNDMTSLASYRHRVTACEMDSLPLIMQGYVDTYGLKNMIGNRTKNSSLYVNKIEQFNSIFDGAAIGQYLGGVDPRNDKSEPGFINETCLFNPSKLTIEWRVDAYERKVPYVIFEGEAYRINNLHIHSKQLEKFKS